MEERIQDDRQARTEKAVRTLRAALTTMLNQGVSGNLASIASKALRETEGVAGD